jgi:hypothetical protein
MFPHGAWYSIQSALSQAAERTWDPDDILLTFGPTTNSRFVLVYAMSAAFEDNTGYPLTQTNAMEVVRVSAHGTGGTSLELVEPFEIGSDLGSPDGLTMSAPLTSGYDTPPVVDSVQCGPYPFALDRGWNWSAAQAGQPIVVRGNPGTGLGFRVKARVHRKVNTMMSAIVLVTGHT